MQQKMVLDAKEIYISQEKNQLKKLRTNLLDFLLFSLSQTNDQCLFLTVFVQKKIGYNLQFIYIDIKK